MDKGNGSFNMKYETEILNKLIDKYENRTDGSNRRVRIILEKNEISVPDVEDEKYSDFLSCVLSLKETGYIDCDWIRKNYVLKSIWLKLEMADEIYTFLQRENRTSIVASVVGLIDITISDIKTEWIYKYLSDSKNKLVESNKLTGIWNKEKAFLREFLNALNGIDKLNGNTISMRSFSIKIYGNSKTFERNIKQYITSVIKKYEPDLQDVEEPNDRVVLAQVGIIMMSEIFEFCGNIKIDYSNGTVDYSPVKKGACISSDCVSEIEAIDIFGTEKIIFIENKTNYTEYCLNNKSDSELVVYHGGFYSPLRGEFFRKLCVKSELPVFFWGDIDYGGFKMFMRLKNNIIPTLLPLNMDSDSYNRYKDNGLKRDDKYIKKLAILADHPDYLLFSKVIHLIVENKVTVEQESFLG